MMLSNVAIGPKNCFNLFSATKAMKQVWKLEGDNDKGLLLKKSDMTIKFDIRITTLTRHLGGLFQKNFADRKGD